MDAWQCQHTVPSRLYQHAGRCDQQRLRVSHGCSAAAPWTGPRLVLQGSAAGWVKDDLDGQEDAHRRGAAPGPEPDGMLHDEHGSRPLPSLPGDWTQYYRELVLAVRGEGPVPVEPGDAVSVQKVLEAAADSSARQQVVHLR